MINTTNHLKPPQCSLCSSTTSLLYKNRTREYFRCNGCMSVLLHPTCHLSPAEEKKRYEEHNNNVEDPGYQAFVLPVINEVVYKYKQGKKGLDFGAGTGPVITKLLKEKGYEMELYDPFFWNDPRKLQGKYDFIVCCEVIEHFHEPVKEFKLLHSLLKKGGSLFCMTDFLVEEKDFPAWYYKNDPTHVFFYHHEALEWIKREYAFSNLVVKGRVFELIA